MNLDKPMTDSICKDCGRPKSIGVTEIGAKHGTHCWKDEFSDRLDKRLDCIEHQLRSMRGEACGMTRQCQGNEIVKSAYVQTQYDWPRIIADKVGVPSDNLIHEWYQLSTIEHHADGRHLFNRTKFVLQKYAEWLTTPPPAPEKCERRVPKDETGWLIENGSGTAYRFMDNDAGGIVSWTPDHDKALRFARRVDAEQFCHHDEDAWAVVEHMWCSKPKPPIAAQTSACEKCGGFTDGYKFFKGTECPSCNGTGTSTDSGKGVARLEH